MRKVTLNIKRYDPETKESGYQEYNIEVEDNAAVLDAIIQVREYVDPTLAVRCSCRSAICGSCGMRVNGHAKLACKAKVSDVAPDGEAITIEPFGNTGAIKDLVVDMRPFWSQVKQVEPWLRAHQPPPDKEYIAPHKAMVDLAGTMNCIMCGCCVSDCTVLEVDKSFIGPAALAKAYRFVGDPRETQESSDDRLQKLSEEGGVWDCTHCFECVQVCPKDVAPMERILDIRRAAMEAGYRDNNGFPSQRVLRQVGQEERLAGRASARPRIVRPRRRRGSDENDAHWNPRAPQGQDTTRHPPRAAGR